MLRNDAAGGRVVPLDVARGVGHCLPALHPFLIHSKSGGSVSVGRDSRVCVCSGVLSPAPAHFLLLRGE